MWEPAWKRLVHDLNRQGFKSPYLDRLTARIGYTPDHAGLQQEIMEEMAYSLGKAADKVNVALLRLDVVAHELRQASSAVHRASLAAEFNRLRDEAVQARWELMVHREALGLTRHDDLDIHYPIPPRARRCVG